MCLGRSWWALGWVCGPGGSKGLEPCSQKFGDVSRDCDIHRLVAPTAYLFLPSFLCLFIPLLASFCIYASKA